MISAAFDALCRATGLNLPDCDPASAVRRLLNDAQSLDLLAQAAEREPILPPAAERSDRSVLFLNNAYYHFPLLAKELRKRGWDALAAMTVSGAYDDRHLLHDGHLTVTFGTDAESWIKGAQLCVEIARRFKIVHFYGVDSMAVNPHLKGAGRRPFDPIAPVEFEFFKRMGLLVGYSAVGCNDGIAQNTWNAWTGGMCGKCRFRDAEAVCSDAKNLGWGRLIAQTADVICAEMMPRLDFLNSPKVVSYPVAYGLDPAEWSPDLEVPPDMRLEKAPGEILILHGFANQTGRAQDGADPKGTKIIEQAVARLQAEGLSLRLIFLTGIPSDKIRYLQTQADIVVDQIYFGRYGAQARECMMLGKPVVGFFKPDGGEFGLAKRVVAECPIVRADAETLPQVLKDLALNPERRSVIGRASREYALKHHAVGVGADRFERLYARVGVGASLPDAGKTPMYDIPLIRPLIDDAVKDRVWAVLESRFLSEGAVVRDFETRIADYVGARRAVAATNATTALEMTLRCMSIGPGDEVIVPDYTYPATADAVAAAGATAVIVDVDPADMLMDLDALERALSPRTKAVMPVSAFGNPLNYDALNALKAKYGFKIVEDAAPSLGSSYRGRRTGVLADATIFSFHPRKAITTGEGGMITTDEDDLADRLKSYKHFGMGVQDGKLQPYFRNLGTNSKMSDVLAAIGLAQMDRIDEILDRRLVLAARYDELLADAENVDFVRLTEGGVHSRQTYTIFIPDRDRVMGRLRAMGIEAQIGTYALHREQAFARHPQIVQKLPLSGSEQAYHACLALPMHHHMTDQDQQDVVRELSKLI